MFKSFKVGDRIKVIDQEIYGKIVKDYGTEVVIEDEDAPTDDNTLCFKKSEVEETYGIKFIPINDDQQQRKEFDYVKSTFKNARKTLV